MKLELGGRHDAEHVTYLVRYSNDGGENWLALTVGLPASTFVVDLDTLPGGTAAFSR